MWETSLVSTERLAASNSSVRRSSSSLSRSFSALHPFTPVSGTFSQSDWRPIRVLLRRPHLESVDRPSAPCPLETRSRSAKVATRSAC